MHSPAKNNSNFYSCCLVVVFEWNMIDSPAALIELSLFETFSYNLTSNIAIYTTDLENI